MRAWHARQRSIHMRLGSWRAGAVAARLQFSHTCFTIRSWNHAACLALLRLYTGMQIIHPPKCVGSLVVLGELADLPWSLSFAMDCKTAKSNSGLFMCSQTRIPQYRKDMFHMTHTLLLFFASSQSGANKRKCSNVVPLTQPFRVQSGADTCLLDGTFARPYRKRQLCRTE